MRRKQKAVASIEAASNRLLLDKKMNSMAAFLKANDGDLVESDNASYYKRWRLIRSVKLSAQSEVLNGSTAT